MLLAMIGLLTIIASFLYAPHCDQGPILCPLRLATGLPCPGCGLTRSFCAMASGHVAQAFASHWFGPALFIAVVAAVPLLAIEIITRRRFALLHNFIFSRTAGYAFGAALMAYHGFRLAAMIGSGHLLNNMGHSLLGSALRWVVHPA